MQLTCRHCQQTIEFSGPRPAFCGRCGQPLAAADSDVTVDFRPEPAGKSTQFDRTSDSPLPTGTTADRVGAYRLLQPLGQGGMGTVWEAEQADTGRRVALKLLSPRLRPTAENVDRFLREGKLAASLSHPRSTFVFDAGQHEGQPYIAMELMPGRTLKDLIDESGPLPVETAVDYVLDAIDGLEAAHALGIVHRDVKPSNCFIDSDGRVKVGDFGLSKSLVSETDLTHTGTFLGTPQFAAPEQVRGGGVDTRTDVYAVGATLFCLLTGRGPFIGDAASVIAQIVSEPAPALSSLRPDVRQSLSRIVSRTLEKDPGRRFDDLARLRRALTPFASGGVSMADVGRRLAAYMLDSILVSACTTFCTMSVAIVMAIKTAEADSHDTTADYSPTVNVAIQFFSATVQVLYFAFMEGRFGRGLGKQLMGLRVIAPDGDRPGYGRSLSRALLVPGAAGLTLVLPLTTLLWPAQAADYSSLASVSRTIIVGAPPFLFILLCLTTMRARNGYRGLHELISGTRVVRLRRSVDQRRRPLPVVLPVMAVGRMKDGAVRFGPFRRVGELGQSGDVSVLEARDELLGRPVWVNVGPHGSEVADTRRTIARSTRPHWLQGGDTADGRWNAFEAVVGSPLIEVAQQVGGAPWHESRFWLLDLSEELLAAVAEGTLPEPLSLEQVWLTRGGRLKLLDRPITAHGAARGDAGHVGPGPRRALELLQAAVRLCTREQILPMHVRQFADELASRSATQETLAWAAGQLREAVKQPAALSWDDRLGILAVSMGTELSLYVMAAMVVPWVLMARLHWPIKELVGPLVLVVMLPAALGFACRGGPAFWLTRVNVLSSNGQRAGRWRCAWRNLIAWTPMVVFYIFLGLFSARLLPSADGQPRPLEFAPGEEREAWLFLGGICGGELLGLLFLMGAIYAVVRPMRGLQDLLAGTWLAPR